MLLVKTGTPVIWIRVRVRFRDDDDVRQRTDVPVWASAGQKCLSH